jgi:hypothetical protein
LAQKSGEAVDSEEAVDYEVTSTPESSERAADGESAKVLLCAFFRGSMAWGVNGYINSERENAIKCAGRVRSFGVW